MREETIKFKEFKRDNEKLMAQPIVRRFLDDEENLKLLNGYLEGDEKAAALLDERFKQHHNKAKIINYLSSLIYYFSIDYDKRAKLKSYRFPLILNKRLNVNEKDNSEDLLGTFGSETVPYEEIVDNKYLENIFTNKSLAKAITKLTDKQKEIVSLFYIYQYSNKEIAEYLKESEQNISNLKRRALKTLYKFSS
ncbi:RNA polymerase sigma factor [Halobacillus amylolyticus]|uniref:Sigma-70 family RNA polymerase sigma factor n=1 Tax=Halobacillus amylolyticus TaxID=2932259 RepID=A0ABY4HHU1_9BACI|nr:sigma-70 family RNA polymerase sigma factor [Halobacillus amylolyticus]UOR14194.1 sigma-70 family RNA polymerase sigma factor [Halobacillus amylolyticus]